MIAKYLSNSIHIVNCRDYLIAIKLTKSFLNCLKINIFILKTT